MAKELKRESNLGGWKKPLDQLSYALCGHMLSPRLKIPEARKAFEIAHLAVRAHGISPNNTDIIQTLLEPRKVGRVTLQPTIDGRPVIFSNYDYFPREEDQKQFAYGTLEDTLQILESLGVVPKGGYFDYRFETGEENVAFISLLEADGRSLEQEVISPEVIRYSKQTNIPGININIDLKNTSSSLGGIPNIREFSFTISIEAFVESFRQ